MYKKIAIACAVLLLFVLLFLISAFVAGIVSPPPVDESTAAVTKIVPPGARISAGSPAAAAAGTAAAPTPRAADESVKTKVAGTVQVNADRYAAAIEKGTVYDLMEAARSKGLAFETEYHSGLGFFITSIGGVGNDPGNGRYWTLYVNGDRSNLGASNYPLTDGDLIEWKLEKN